MFLPRRMSFHSLTVLRFFPFFLLVALARVAREGAAVLLVFKMTCDKKKILRVRSVATGS